MKDRFDENAGISMKAGAATNIMDQKAAKMAPFKFRNLHPRVFPGTASDRYAGWLGQNYTPEKYVDRIIRHLKNLEKNSYVEEVLPLGSVVEYFEHCAVLED